MFFDNNVKKKFDGEERYDKFAIAGAIFGMSFEGTECSMLKSQVLENCKCCNLRYICNRVNEIVEDFTKSTTVVTDSFKFQ